MAEKMKFKIPLTFSKQEILKKRAEIFSRYFKSKKKRKLDEYLTNLDANLTSSDYLGISSRTFIFSFITASIIGTTLFFLINIRNFYLYGLGLALLFSGYLFMQQINYPRIFNLKKTREVEKNLIPALQDALVQLQSGIPIFQIMVGIAKSDYGFVSYEFKKAVNNINSGVGQIEAIEELIRRNSSVYFKRILWQISNGLRSGSDMAVVIRDSIDSLNKEQAIQIQSYAGKLNPLIMFYMLVTVIMPSLGITFLVIISSMLNLSTLMVQLMFVTVFVVVILLQILFLGIIRTRRPSLL